MILVVAVTFAQGKADGNLTVLYDINFEQRIDMLDLEGVNYDSVRVKFNVGDIYKKSVKVTIYDKRGHRIYRHTFKKMDCVQETKSFDDILIVVGRPSMFFLVIKKCDDGPKFCVVREREGLQKDLDFYLMKYFRREIK